MTRAGRVRMSSVSTIGVSPMRARYHSPAAPDAGVRRPGGHYNRCRLIKYVSFAFFAHTPGFSPLFSAVFRGTAIVTFAFALFARSTQQRGCDGIDKTRHPHHCRSCSAFSND